MADFRFQGVVPSGKIVQGTITAGNATEAKKKIQDLSKGRSFRLDKLEKRGTFVYKAQKGDKVLEGEQKAYSKDEVVNALVQMGYKVVFVRKKVGVSIGKPPVGDVITFVRLSADLLREKLPFNEVLNLLANDIDNKVLRETLKDINTDLRKGAESERVFTKYENIFGKFTAKMLGLASKSGNMAEMYDSTAKFLERRMEFKKSMKSAMLMPMITLVLLILATIFYVAYIFPETARMFLKYGIELPPMTEATLEMSDWLVANILWFILAFAGMVAGGVMFWSNPKGREWLDKQSFRIPVMGGLIHKTAIEVFCRVFYSMYSGSGENIDIIKTAAEATGNSYFENQIKRTTIPMMLKHGKGLHESFEAAGVFTKTALSRFHAGAETGMVRETALQLANYYERETTYKLKSVVDFMQLWVALIIMIVMTAITIVSSETAVIKPKSAPGMGGLGDYTMLVATSGLFIERIRNFLHGCRLLLTGTQSR
ncbi:MAG TPA: type II secretion system F family protein [Bacteroidota bacterium]|nr:type II secretion system F family protein [Bacteroidota bacterium]